MIVGVVIDHPSTSAHQFPARVKRYLLTSVAVPDVNGAIFADGIYKVSTWRDGTAALRTVV